jgi:hypothetical protein
MALVKETEAIRNVGNRQRGFRKQTLSLFNS